jgi:nitroreductase
MNNEVKLATPDHEILDVIARRFSPYVFQPRAVERDKLMSCLEAARWAPSSYNEQPWSFLIAERDGQEFQRMLDCLLEGNQAWAKNAGFLLITVAAETFSRNNKPNRVCDHDIGLAAGNLTLQAMSLGLHVHQMEGINLSKTRHVYGIPDSHHPLTAIAIGYAGDPDNADNEQLAQRDKTPRKRKSIDDIIFQGQWNKRWR